MTTTELPSGPQRSGLALRRRVVPGSLRFGVSLSRFRGHPRCAIMREECPDVSAKATRAV